MNATAPEPEVSGLLMDGLPIAYRDGDIALYQVGAAIRLRPQDKRTAMVPATPDLGGGTDPWARSSPGYLNSGRPVQGARVQSGRGP